MRVSVVGAGPGGLYLAILLRKAGHEVTVLERNAPDATFGWGVVFSEETLGALREADPPTHLELTDSFARWSGVDIRFRATLVRSHGHTFTAIARTRLLAILQRRATDLGAVLRFGVEADTADLDADLVVAADGANSRTRSAAPNRFGASSRPQGGKYVWFGTDLVLDAFTFAFRETEHGLFQVHAYPFDEHTSTWIVECAEPVWRRAGLADSGEAETIAFCQDLFADELAGHRLLSNRSRWLDFPLVRCARWYDGNTVLLGDAAHTAHFSIGSGTKLAMEDSIELAAALRRHPADLTAALIEYEGERQAVVERFQQAAGDSAAYFLRTGDHTAMAPIQFAFNLLTRSGRVGHANLSQRDPDLVRVLDAWFAHDGATPVGAVAPPPLFAPLRLREARVPNRLVTEDLERATAGAGLVLVGPAAVSAPGRITLDTPVVESPRPWREAAERVHAAGALLGLRLTHAGARGSTRSPEYGVDVPLPARLRWPLLAASDRAYGPGSPVPKAMDDDDRARVREEFVAAARVAAEAGVDVLELDLADGRLLAGFLSPLTNPDQDRLGYPLSVVDAVRAVWPGLLAARLCVTDLAAGGLRVDDGVRIAAALRDHGVGLIHVRAGHTIAQTRPDYRRGFLTTLSDRVRAEAKVPTLVGGYLTTPDEVNTIVGAGRADLCVLTPRPTPLDEVVRCTSPT